MTRHGRRVIVPPRARMHACMHLEALAVDDGGARLLVLLLGDPHGGEGGERRENGTTDPDGVLALRGSNNLGLDGLGGEGGELLGDAVSETIEHSGTTGEDDVVVEILANINVALVDGLEDGAVDTLELKTNEGRLEEELRAAETLVADGDDVAIGKLVRLLALVGALGLGQLSLVVLSDVGETLLDVTDNLTLGGGGEGVATLGEDLDHVVSEVTAGKVETLDGVGESITLIDGDGVGDTITRVHDDTGGAAGSVEGKDGLNGDVGGGDAEGVEHDLNHLLTVGLGVEGGLSKEDGVLLGGNTELVEEGVVPDLLHIVPVGDDTVLNGVLDGEDTTLGLGLITDVSILLAHTNHGRVVAGTADNGREDGAGSVITGETGLAHTGTVVNNESLGGIRHT